MDSKSIDGDIVRVQVPQPAFLGRGKTVGNVNFQWFFLLCINEAPKEFFSPGASLFIYFSWLLHLLHPLQDPQHLPAFLFFQILLAARNAAPQTISPGIIVPIFCISHIAGNPPYLLYIDCFAYACFTGYAFATPFTDTEDTFFAGRIRR